MLCLLISQVDQPVSAQSHRAGINFPSITLSRGAPIFNYSLKGGGNFPSWADHQIGNRSLLPIGVLTTSKQLSLNLLPWTWLTAISPISSYYQVVKWRITYCPIGTPEHFESTKHCRELSKVHNIGQMKWQA